MRLFVFFFLLDLIPLLFLLDDIVDLPMGFLFFLQLLLSLFYFFLLFSLLFANLRLILLQILLVLILFFSSISADTSPASIIPYFLPNLRKLLFGLETAHSLIETSSQRRAVIAIITMVAEKIKGVWNDSKAD